MTASRARRHTFGQPSTPIVDCRARGVDYIDDYADTDCVVTYRRGFMGSPDRGSVYRARRGSIYDVSNDHHSPAGRSDGAR